MPKIHYTCFPVGGEVANLLRSVSDTTWQQVIVMEFGKRYNTHDGLCPSQVVTDLSFMLRTCSGLATGTNLLWGN